MGIPKTDRTHSQNKKMLITKANNPNVRTTYQLDIRALEPALVANAALAYRAVLERAGCRIARERKSPQKGRATFIVHVPAKVTREALEECFEQEIEATLRGAVDWEME